MNLKSNVLVKTKLVVVSECPGYKFSSTDCQILTDKFEGGKTGHDFERLLELEQKGELIVHQWFYFDKFHREVPYKSGKPVYLEIYISPPIENSSYTGIFN
jgi:hypothetical protein